jgi:hypothetical protein
MTLREKIDQRFIDIIIDSRPIIISSQNWLDKYKEYESHQNTVPQYIDIIDSILTTKKVTQHDFINRNKFLLVSFIQAEANSLKFVLDLMLQSFNFLKNDRLEIIQTAYNEFIQSFSEEITEFTRIIG